MISRIESCATPLNLKPFCGNTPVSFDLNDDESFVLLLTDKSNNKMHEFEEESYSVVIEKAYSYLLRKLKEVDE